MQRMIVKAATLTTDTGDTGQMDEVGDVSVVDVSELSHISIYLNQITDNGTVTIVLEKSVDGTNWAVVDASTVESDFVAGANTALEFTLSDANGMPTHAKQIRARMTVHTGTGGYTMTVAGSLRAGYR